MSRIYRRGEAKEQIARQNKSQNIVFRLKYGCLDTTFVRWLDMTNKQISLKNRSARIIHLMKTGCLVKFFELMDKNAREHRP
jgi:hypothetical protein